jgi:aspartate/methionine/tyrosine aminotransferase
MLSARESVANYLNKNSNEGDKNGRCDSYRVTAEDIILTNGCSLSIEIASRALASIGDNILIPRPTWNYTTWMNGSGIEVQNYNLLPDENFFIDLEHLESLINERTKAILVNNVGECNHNYAK